ncbi:MAG: hypothetical protein AB1657_02720 [Candidatus Micrarchaeota archaeon]
MPEEKKAEKKAVAAAPAPKAAGGDKDSNLLAALGYLINFVLLPWSFVIYYVKKEDKFVRFHALQAGLLWVVGFLAMVALGIFGFLLSIVGGPLGCIFGILQLAVGLALVAVALYAAYMAYRFEEWEIPVLGGVARSHL